jgi:hypothetical protein
MSLEGILAESIQREKKVLLAGNVGRGFILMLI